MDKIEIDFHNKNSYDLYSINENSLSIIGENQQVNQAPIVPLPTLPIRKFEFIAFLMLFVLFGISLLIIHVFDIITITIHITTRELKNTKCNKKLFMW